MNFAQKQAYYHALGIDSWVPRRTLNGAAPGHLVLPLSPARPLAGKISPGPAGRSPSGETTSVRQQRSSRPASQPRSNQAASAPRTGQPSSRPSGRQLIDELVNDQDKNQDQDARRNAGTGNVDASAARPAANPTSQRAGSLQFELICVIHEQVMLLDDITGLKLTPSAYNDWLKSIFFALGLPHKALSVGSDDRLVWPPVASLAKPVAQQAQRSAAAEMLHAWIQRKLAGRQRGLLPGHIVLMGAKPRELLLAKGSAATAGDTVELPLFAGSKALLLPGSNELWAAPLGKRECWKQLQAIDIDTVSG